MYVNSVLLTVVLYVFRCAVYFASKQHNPELLKWWHWKEKK